MLGVESNLVFQQYAKSCGNLFLLPKFVPSWLLKIFQAYLQFLRALQKYKEGSLPSVLMIISITHLYHLLPTYNTKQKPHLATFE